MEPCYNSESISKYISNIIKSKRNELHLSYQDLANKTGLSKSTLQRYETGSIKNIPLDKLELIINALDIDPSFLLQCSNVQSTYKNKQLSNNELKLLENFNKLNDLGKAKLIEYSNDLIFNIKFTNDSNMYSELLEFLKKDL